MTDLVASRPVILGRHVLLARPNVFEIDLEAIARFTYEIRKSIGPKVTYFAVLKSNAYGFGLEEVADTVLAAGADGLAVVDRAHAITLRVHGVSAPILVYAGNAMNAATALADQEFDLIPTITDLSVAKLYSQYATRSLRVAVKVDVGQERLGVPDIQAVGFIKAMFQLPHLVPFIINAHPSVPAGCSDRYLEWQYERFLKVCEALIREKIVFPISMFADSKILHRTSSMLSTGIDPGLAVFGLLSEEKSRRQAFHALKSELIHVRSIIRKEFLKEVPFPIREGMKMGVIPIGAADGMASLHCGEVLVRGQRTKVLGEPHLEYTRIDLTDTPDAEIGDEVVIVGRQGGSEITQEEVVAYQGLDGREDLAMAVRSTIPRRYLR